MLLFVACLSTQQCVVKVASIACDATSSVYVCLACVNVRMLVVG